MSGDRDSTTQRVGRTNPRVLSTCPGELNAAPLGTLALLSLTMPAKTVLVTGATGYIASHTIQQLLEKTDFAVRGTVRNLQDTAKFAHLTSLPHANTRLQLVQADLLYAASWGAAVRGCAAVFHIAIRAETKAWALVDGVKGKRLVVLNPGVTIGPTLSKAINTSALASIQVFNGQLPVMIPLSFCVVDVRDVAWAHIQALQTPTASGRYLLAGQTSSMQAIAAIFRSKFPAAKHIPTRTVPSWVAWLASLKESRAMGQFLRANIGVVFQADNAKSIRELKMTYRPLEESLVDMINDAAHVEP
ncbi:Aste57867_18572 [Aphanomyces stellatus]|uniref:Aste57867_18572 protein n=1 Tax=Aphanomyces stellatus TaxID=120398 RepID=A0A485LAG4_9STRA|nr:hypothetical protein As57867_018510 [Aphanomyces stellatus]VFT95308.1 Aste57867_18572 [Aphanomyces stellatus]